MPNMSQHVVPNNVVICLLKGCDRLAGASKYWANTVAICLLKRCDRLAGASKYWANNVAICCADMPRSFGRGFKAEHEQRKLNGHV